MRVPFVDLTRKLLKFSSLTDRGIARVLNSGIFILGPEVKNFEIEFARYIGTEFCIGTANGTDALEIALRACGVDAHKKVATVANAGFYTSTALHAIGAEPIYIDVDLETRNVELESVRKVINEGVYAVVITHLYGLAVAETEAIIKLCHENGVMVVEDCAQAHGASIGGKRVGSFGDAAAFSFYPTKNLGAYGDAGAVVTTNKEIREKAMSLRSYGWREKYFIESQVGRNSRLDEIQAAILTELLPNLDKDNERRLEIANYYIKHIRNKDIQLPSHEISSFVAHLFVLRSPYRDSLQKQLAEHGIDSMVHYPISDNDQVLNKHKSSKTQLQNTKILTQEILSIPCYPEMSDEEVEYVTRTINELVLS